MSRHTKKIMVLIPCYNEEKGIKDVITGFPISQLRNNGFDLEVVVIDNNSVDKTTEVAKSCGATVLFEEKKGKGNAVRKGFEYVSKDTDYVVMLDGDNTYSSSEILRLVDPLYKSMCTAVVGNRLTGTMEKGAMRTFNKIGNKIFSTGVRLFYRVPASDVLTGYYAWTRETIERLRPHIQSNGFCIEMEMMTKMAKLNEIICSVPISYHPRSGQTNLHPIRDGFKILRMFLRNLFWKPRLVIPHRIAFVSDAVWPWHKGGKEKRLYEIAQHLVKEGKDVHIYTMNWWNGRRHIKQDNIHYHAICGLYPLYRHERRSIRQALLFGTAVFRLLFTRFDLMDVDHIPFFPLFSARIVTWLRGKKLYATWHEVWGKEYWTQYAKGIIATMGSLVESISFRLPDVIISNSKHTTKRLHDVGVIHKVHTVPLGIHLQDIYKAAPAAQASDILYTGRLISHKNVDLLVRAVAIVKNRYPSIICRIIGDGPEKANINALIQKFNLQRNVLLIDSSKISVPVYSFMKAAKMLVLPSIREGFGIVVLEANAAGIPVITTSHHDNAAKDLIIEGVNGLLSDVNEASIANQIIQILENGSHMQPTKNIERHDWSAIMEAVKQVFA